MTQAVIFDLDGVLVDTAEFHYRAWQRLADRIGVPFDREANAALRGVDRYHSLLHLLGAHAARFPEEERQAMCAEKNADYVRLIADITPADLLPGAGELLAALREADFKIAVASSSKNAPLVVELLGIAGALDALVNGADVAQAKPDPALFRLAAARVGVRPAQCLVIEDAEAGVEAALRGGMRVIGLGSPALVGAAHAVYPAIGDVTMEVVREVLEGVWV